MNIGVVMQKSDRWPKMEWVARSLETLGHGVLRAYDREGVKLADAECDLLIFQQKSVVRWPNLRDLAEEKQAIWCQWWFDLISLAQRPMEDQTFFHAFRPIMEAMDIVFVKEKDHLADLISAGINARYLDQGAPSWWCQKDGAVSDWQFDIVGWGQCQAPEYRQRNRLLSLAVRSGYTVGWASDSGVVPEGVTRLPWTPTDELPSLAAKGRCVLSVGRRNDIDGYWSDQFWLACATGVPVIRVQTPGMPVGPYWTFSNDAEFKSCVDRCVYNPEFAHERAEECRQWVLKNHKIEHRCQELIEIVQKDAVTATV